MDRLEKFLLARSVGVVRAVMCPESITRILCDSCNTSSHLVRDQDDSQTASR